MLLLKSIDIVPLSHSVSLCNCLPSTSGPGPIPGAIPGAPPGPKPGKPGATNKKKKKKFRVKKGGGGGDLLAAIRGGAKLKKAVTVDKSKPVIAKADAPKVCELRRTGIVVVVSNHPNHWCLCLC